MENRMPPGHTGLPVLRTLVVDDNVDITVTLSMLLRRLGHEAAVANNAREALEVGDATRPQVVFLDIGLPDTCGYDVCKDMRQSDWGAMAFIVALTGRSEPQDLIKAAHTGFDRHVVKPMSLPTLQEILRNVAHQTMLLDPRADGDGHRPVR